MQAIETSYYGATNTKPSGIRAKCDAKTIRVAWDYDLNGEGNHFAAAKKLALMLGWSGHWVGGGVKSGMVWVQTTRGPEFKIYPAEVES